MLFERREEKALGVFILFIFSVVVVTAVVVSARGILRETNALMGRTYAILDAHFHAFTLLVSARHTVKFKSDKARFARETARIVELFDYGLAVV